MKNVTDELRALAKLPDQNAGQWLASAESGVQFLKDQFGTDTTVLYASLKAVMIHGVLVPLEHIASMDHGRLSREFVMPDDAWMIEHVSGGGKPDRVYLAPPCDVLILHWSKARSSFTNVTSLGGKVRLQSRLARSSFMPSIYTLLENAMRGVD